MEQIEIAMRVDAHRNSSGVFKGKVTAYVVDPETRRRRARCIPFQYNPDARSLVLSLVTDEKQVVPLVRILDDPLYRRIGSRDVVYPEFFLLAEQLIIPFRGVFLCHLFRKYPDSWLGKVAPLSQRVCTQAKEEYVLKNGTRWLVTINQDLHASLFALPQLSCRPTCTAYLLAVCEGFDGTVR